MMMKTSSSRQHHLKTSRETSWLKNSFAVCNLTFRGCRNVRTSEYLSECPSNQSGSQLPESAPPSLPWAIICIWSEASTLTHAKKLWVPRSMEDKLSGKGFLTLARKLCRDANVTLQLLLTAGSIFSVDVSCSTRSVRFESAQASFSSLKPTRNKWTNAKQQVIRRELAKTIVQPCLRRVWSYMVVKRKVESFIMRCLFCTWSTWNGSRFLWSREWPRSYKEPAAVLCLKLIREPL